MSDALNSNLNWNLDPYPDRPQEGPTCTDPATCVRPLSVRPLPSSSHDTHLLPSCTASSVLLSTYSSSHSSLFTLHFTLHFRSAARVRALRATQLSPSGAPSLRGRGTRCVNWCEGRCGHCEDCTCLCPIRSRTVGCTVIICVCKCCWMGCGSSYDMTPHPSLLPRSSQP